mmetsp:Transcript_30408/g.40146  ORF Transcript_30408/g.40146 Transcript_30408/m.40146 type:complete len:852 (+) Transcript_30408:38-2593(+)
MYPSSESDSGSGHLSNHGRWARFNMVILTTDLVATFLLFFGTYKFSMSNVEDHESSFDWQIGGADIFALGLVRCLLLACTLFGGKRLRQGLALCAQFFGLVSLVYLILKSAVLHWKASKVQALMIVSLVLAVMNISSIQALKKERSGRVKVLALYDKLNTDDESERLEAGEKKKNLSFWQLIYVLKPYFWPSATDSKASLNRLRSSMTWFFVGASKAASVISPIFLAHATNELTSSRYHNCIVNIGVYVAFCFMAKLFKEMQGLIYLKVKQAAYIEIAETTFTHLHNLSLQWHLKKKMGNVIRSMDRGTEAANTLVTYLFLYLVPSLAECFAVCVVFLLKFRVWKIALLAFMSIAIYMFVTVKITLWRKQFRQKTNKHDNEFHDKATDSIINYETVKYFTNEPFEIKRFCDSVRKYQHYSINVQASLSFLNMTQQVIVQGTVLGGLIISALAVKDGAMDVGSFVAVNTYMVNLFTPLNFLGTVYNAIINALVDIRNLSELLAESPDVVDEPGAPELPGLGMQSKGMSVEYRNVHFRYPEQPESSGIQGLSFIVPPGTTTALVGHTGAGKTTIARLLFRFYDPLSGQVLMNGHDIRRVKQRSVRAAVGVVPQDTVMFNDSILHNVKYGRMDATMAEVEAACEAAQILDFIMTLPEKWETVVGERGLKLSGGEKQRVAIARCLLKDPPIVLLDEATSALDTKTEVSVQKALTGLRANRTTLVIAHRLSTIRYADQIIVLRKGQTVESGSHQELLAKDGEYTSMWRMQLRSSSKDERSLYLDDLKASGVVSSNEILIQEEEEKGSENQEDATAEHNPSQENKVTEEDNENGKEEAKGLEEKTLTENKETKTVCD